VSAPAAAPNSADDTVKPSTAELAENWSPIAFTAPLMTALSYPNKNPPSAAVSDSRITVPFDSPGSKTSSSISTSGSS
jgi:pilus assembly protein TadC